MMFTDKRATEPCVIKDLKDITTGTVFSATADFRQTVASITGIFILVQPGSMFQLPNWKRIGLVSWITFLNYKELDAELVIREKERTG